MAKRKTVAASRVKAKAEGLELPLSTPVVGEALAKPVRLPDAPSAAVKKAVRKTAAKASKSQPAGKPAQRPGKTVAAADPIAEGRVMIVTLQNCGVLAAKGAESLGKEVVSLARGSLQAQFALTEALINAGTLQEALTLQGDFARDSLGNMAEGITRLTNMSMELTQSFMAPIHAQGRANLT